MLDRNNIGWSVENPSTSLMWVTRPFTDLMAQLGTKCLGFCFHNCMFGSRRKKLTAIWTCVSELKQLAKTCDDSHDHEAWGVTHDGSIATAQECAYDPILCAHWADAIARYAERMGYSAPPATLFDVAPEHLHVKDVANRAILGALPRGNRLPPLLTDFLDVQVVNFQQFPFLQQIQPGARLPDTPHFPKGARLLRFLNDQKGVEIGMPVDPKAYIAQTCKLVHPNLQAVRLSDGMENAIWLHGEKSAVDLRRVRIAWTKSMISMYNQCRDVEERTCVQRPEHMRSVLEGKKFELMTRSLEAIGYSDSSIAAEASEGLPLVGWMKPSGMFAANLWPPELHVDSLVKMAASFSKRAIASVHASHDSELDMDVWTATLDEVKGGTLEGPFEVQDLPQGHVVSPRFGLRQGAKTRPIDNLTASGINSTVGLPERLQVDTIDEVASMIKRFMQVHGSTCKLVGRTYDLRKAYRQLAVGPGHYKFAWIAVWSPVEGRTRLFRMKGLPFGGTASVASFLRVSRALKEKGIRGGALMWSSFFDDFICIAKPEDAGSALGWVLSADPEKDKGFASCFTAFGVEFDLSETHNGVLRIGNTQRRRDELEALVKGFIKAEKLTCTESESLRSRLNFAEGQVFGRSAKLALQAIGSPVRNGRDCEPLSEEVRFGLRWMLDRIVHAPPRLVTTAWEPTLMLFVDGACEPAPDSEAGLVTSVGAILLDCNGKGLKFFGMSLPDEVTNEWGRNGRRQLVFEAEVLPYLLALECWRDLMSKHHVLVFIDNDGARHSWVRGGADSFHAMRMIHKGALLEAHLDVKPFFCRVPTSSNVADGPSRQNFQMCRELGAVQTVVPLETLRKCALGACDAND